MLCLLAACGSSRGLESSAEIEPVMVNVGFDLAPYDPASGRAGDLVIAGVEVPAPDPNAAAAGPQAAEHEVRKRYLFLPYGAPGYDGRDPQWNFVLPLGTAVIAPVTGTVCDVPLLYSNDYSVRIAPEGLACDSPGSVLFETEHVLSPLVGVGDRVTAGQQVAVVSDYQTEWKEAGFGVVEVGVAFVKEAYDGELIPWHACPSLFLDPEVKADVLAALRSVMSAWEEESGLELYADASNPEPGCFTGDDVRR